MKSMISRLCHEISISEKTGGFSNPTIFSEAEKNLLIESLPSGQFIVFESDSFEPHLVTGEQIHWFSENDEYYQEFMLDAFSLLCKRGYVRHVKLHQFKLSRRGFQYAYGLVDDSQQGTSGVNAA